MIKELHESEHYLNSKIKSFQSNSDIDRKINEMYAIHFPANRLKKINQRERFFSTNTSYTKKKMFI
jgi:hypothetical protein